MNTAIFLGAGASKSVGAPLQDELFFEYFKEFGQGDDPYYLILKDFFKKAYEIDVNNTDDYPTFEEILGLLYTAEKRQESFYFDIEQVKEGIIYSMAEILDKKMVKSNTFHHQLIENLKRENKLENVVFITTNYDLLMDSAILLNNFNIDYGFRNLENSNTTSKSIPLYKVYGSLNWKYCDVCDNLIISSKVEDGILRSIFREDYTCTICNNQFKSIIVPPTFYKEINNYYLNNIYHNINKTLYEIDHIIFCGYSMPDADLYIKFILKRAELYKERPFKVTVVNCYKGKSEEKIEKEKHKYRLFFNGEVNYTDNCFEDFSKMPGDFIDV